MASLALRQVFLEATITLGRAGDTETADALVQRVRQADAEAGQRIGRGRGSTAASRQAEAERALAMWTAEQIAEIEADACSWCGDSGMVLNCGAPVDCPRCSGQ